MVAYIIHSLVINHEGTIGSIEEDVGSVAGVVGFNGGNGDVDSGINDELELGLAAIVIVDVLHQEGAETGTGTTTE